MPPNKYRGGAAGVFPAYACAVPLILRSHILLAVVSGYLRCFVVFSLSVVCGSCFPGASSLLSLLLLHVICSKITCVPSSMLSSITVPFSRAQPRLARRKQWTMTSRTRLDSASNRMQVCLVCTDDSFAIRSRLSSFILSCCWRGSLSVVSLPFFCPRMIASLLRLLFPFVSHCCLDFVDRDPSCYAASVCSLWLLDFSMCEHLDFISCSPQMKRLAMQECIHQVNSTFALKSLSHFSKSFLVLANNAVLSF